MKHKDDIDSYFKKQIPLDAIPPKSKHGKSFMIVEEAQRRCLSNPLTASELDVMAMGFKKPELSINYIIKRHFPKLMFYKRGERIFISLNNRTGALRG